MGSDWRLYLPLRALDFVEWMTEDSTLGYAGVPYKPAHTDRLSRFSLTTAMIESLLVQPWLLRKEREAKLVATDHDAFWAWCIEVGYLTEEQVGLIQAHQLAKLMGAI